MEEKVLEQFEQISYLVDQIKVEIAKAKERKKGGKTLNFSALLRLRKSLLELRKVTAQFRKSSVEYQKEAVRNG